MSPSVAAGDQQADWQSQLLDLENQARRAFLERNIERLKSLWSADLVVNSPINRVLARDEVFDLLRKGVIAHTSFDIHIELIKRQGDIVVVMGHDVVAGNPGSPSIRRRFTNIWSRAGSSWQMIARHANPIG